MFVRCFVAAALYILLCRRACFDRHRAGLEVVLVPVVVLSSARFVKLCLPYFRTLGGVTMATARPESLRIARKFLLAKKAGYRSPPRQNSIFEVSKASICKTSCFCESNCSEIAHKSFRSVSKSPASFSRATRTVAQFLYHCLVVACLLSVLSHLIECCLLVHAHPFENCRGC